MRDRLIERCSLVFRTAPDALRACLTQVQRERFELAERQGFGLVELTHSHLHPPRVRWPGHPGTLDVLTVSLPVTERRSGRRGAILLAQLRTAWLRGRLSPRTESARPRPAGFHFEEHGDQLELDVHDQDGQLLYLRAEPCAEPLGSIFLSARAAAEHFARASFHAPRVALHAPTDASLLAEGRWALHPQAVFELRPTLLDSLGLANAELDSVFRFTLVRPELAQHTLPAMSRVDPRSVCMPGT